MSLYTNYNAASVFLAEYRAADAAWKLAKKQGKTRVEKDAAVLRYKLLFVFSAYITEERCRRHLGLPVDFVHTHILENAIHIADTEHVDLKTSSDIIDFMIRNGLLIKPSHPIS